MGTGLTRRDVLAVAGWAASVIAVPVVADLLAFRTGRESMSGLYGRLVWHPVLGPAVAGGSAAALWHLAQGALDRR